jgi:hypothetical protein
MRSVSGWSLGYVMKPKRTHVELIIISLILPARESQRILVSVLLTYPELMEGSHQFKFEEER